MADNWMTLDEARAAIAARIGRPVPMATVAKWAREGKLAGARKVRTGGRGRDGLRWLVPGETVAAFVPPKMGRPSRAVSAARAVAAVLGRRI